MKELLDLQEKQLIREQYKSHILYKLINQSCKRFEVDMPHLKFSPEEIFLGVILRLEELRDEPDDATSSIRRLWDDLVCKYREREGEMLEGEVHLAVSIVMCILYICLNSQDDAESISRAGELAMAISEHYGAEAQKRLDIIMSDIYQADNGEERLAEWVSEFLDDTNCLSEKIDILLSAKDDSTGLNHDDQQFPLDTAQCIILYSYLFGEGIACLDTNDSRLADFIGAVTPFKPGSIRTVIGRIKNKKTYSGKIVKDALKVAGILKSLKPDIAKDIEETFAP